VTDYAFDVEAVHFHCSDCGQGYFGSDDQGLPSPRRFECISCHGMIEVAQMMVHPIAEDARGDPIHAGTAWEHREYVGRIPAFLDGVASLATRPADYYRRISQSHSAGALVFSVLSAYLAAGVFVAMFSFLIRSGLLGSGLTDGFLGSVRFWVQLAVGVPLGVVAWNYVYGLIIYVVLRLLGQSHQDYEATVRAVAYGSAVLPALCVLPPVGLFWYMRVVASGIESFHRTSRGQALLAAIVPILLVIHVVAVLFYSAMTA